MAGAPAYLRTMHSTDDRTQAGWHESLERSKAQIDAGQTVPLAPFLERLRVSIARMKSRPKEQEPPARRKA